ncbi:cilia- and flagella-associated protein 45-like [Diorhabda carinulata]|uniref:cilia- and flagella-associated protein 45-like n=1 Tax=Diorhabda carinulata TaxID=1163345 RepID=UPI0025A06B33|nr:cilia- and flagella-associated protein 45-like [Diorhabda carinulata]
MLDLGKRISGPFLTKTELDRLEKGAKVMTVRDKMRMLEEAERRENQIRQESLNRKSQLLQARKIRPLIPGSKLEEVETEAAHKNLCLIRRSEELMMERNDKVKQANRIILATKCRAIRNAQTIEKKLIEKQMREENQKLDAMMERVVRENITLEENRRTAAEVEKKKYVKEIEKQVRENEMYRMLEAAKIEEESRMMNEAFEARRREEESKVMEKKNIQSRLKDEFERANESSRRYKSLREEQDRLSDMMIAEFMRMKKDREEALQKEKDLVKLAREKNVAKLAVDQIKRRNMKATMDELNAVRAQEEKEKEWREKERKEVLRRRKVVEDLKESRNKQIEDIRKAQAVALAREEESLNKVLMMQKMLLDLELKKIERRKEESEKHKEFILKQIEEKEASRNKYQQEKYESGKAQLLESAKNDEQVRDYLNCKINKLREIHIPENYIKDIERQIKLIK